jgi:hypothetical protein
VCTRRRSGTVAALAVSSLFFVASCGGSSDGGDTTGKAAETPAAEASAVKQLTEQQVKNAVLAVKDLPAGWAVSETGDSEDSVGKADKAECQRLADFADFADGAKGLDGVRATAGTEYEKDGGSSLVAHEVSDLAGDGAQQYLKDFDSMVGKCGSFHVEADGANAAVEVQPLSVPALGEEAHGFRMAIELPQLGEGAKLTFDVAIVRQGTALSALAFVPGTSGSAGQTFEDLAKRAGDKFVQAVKE